MIGYPKALDRECVMVNGAAVSALGKIMQFHRERLNVAKVCLLVSSLRLLAKEAFVLYQMHLHFLVNFFLDFPFWTDLVSSSSVESKKRCFA